MKENIFTVLTTFSSTSLLQACSRLLNTLGYHSDRTIELKPNNYDGFADLFDIANTNFDTDKAIVKDWQSIDIIFQLTEEDIKKTQSLFETKQVDNTIIESYLFFALELKGDKYTRSELVKITREINKLTAMPAMILFKYSNYLTIAVIDRRLHKRDSAKDVLEKVTLIKDINLPSSDRDSSKVHRAHIDILNDLILFELQRRFEITNFVELHQAWAKTLSTKELNKAFYQRLFYWYLWAVQRVRFPQIRPEEDLIPDEAHQSESVIRLLTRLLFCWFMKEKQSLIPERLFNKDEIKKILRRFDPEDKESSVYYRAILQNLFFATLSVPITKRRNIADSYNGVNKDYGNQYVYRYKEEFNKPEDILDIFKDIPFLNGGLFECLDETANEDNPSEIRLDGFSSNPKKQAYVPDYLFWGEHRGIDLSEGLDKATKSKETVYGIIDILNSYKFTIEENTPLEEEIALDPELLGKVFESLLAYYNPETKANARKQTGSFYTPREIVDYMVRETLIQYLINKCNGSISASGECNGSIFTSDEIKSKDAFVTLVSYDDSGNPFDDETTTQLIDAINNLKLLDPAVGSGAFPMAALHLLVHILRKLDPNNERWKAEQIKTASQITDPKIRHETIANIEDNFTHNKLDYGRKLYLIQNCLYGIDIQPIAIQIAKLRFFISLLVDQDITSPSPHIDKGGNQRGGNFGLMPLPNLDFKLVCANTLISAPEQSYQDSGRLFTQDEFYDTFSSLTSQYFSAYEPTDKKKLRKKIEKLITDKVDDKVRYIQGLSTHYDERFSKLRAEKNKALIEQYAQDIKLWQSYKNLFKHESVGFFETKYFFPEVKDGFDIVIGNPPYIRQEDFKPIKPILEKQSYKVYNSTSDIYTYFYEKGWQVLEDKGHLTFITSNKWMRAKYGEKLRKFLKEKTAIRQIIDFGGHQVFESATVDTNILMFQKNCRGLIYQTYSAILSIKSDFNHSTDLAQYFNRKAITMNQSDLDEKCFTFGDDAMMRLKKKIETVGVPLKDWDVRICFGIKTGFNEAFIIDNETKERLCAEDPKSIEVLKPILRGRDIKRYGYEWAGLWLIKIESGWTNKHKGKSEAEEFFKSSYKAIYKHLKSKGEIKGKGKGLYYRDDKGDYWWELRNCDYYEEFEKEKIIYSEIVHSPQFYFDSEKFYIEATVFLMTGAFVKYTCGLLNSNPVTFFFKEWYAGGGLGEEGYRYKKAFLENLPIPPVNNNNKPLVHQIEKLVDQMLDAKNNPLNPPLTKVEIKNSATTALDRQIDELVYKLYGLTDDEIAIVEGKR